MIKKRYKVRYYVLGSLRSKIFDSLHEATQFVVYKIRAEQVHDFYVLNE
jgi:hypothetical protein